MATVSARLDASMSGNDVTSRVDAQVDNLMELVKQLEALSKNPPSDVQALLRTFGDIPLPEFQFVGQLSTQLVNARGALPDPSVVLSGVLGGLQKLQTDFGGAVGSQLEKAL